MQRCNLPRWLMLCLLVGCCLGCGNSGLVSVKGKVTFNGEPVKSGTITFGAKDKPSAYGNLNPDGTYELMTDKPGDGATPGAYQVIVVAMNEQVDKLPEERDPLPAPTVPTKYTSFATSDLTAEVKPGEDNVLDFNLTGTLTK